VLFTLIPLPDWLEVFIGPSSRLAVIGARFAPIFPLIAISSIQFTPWVVHVLGVDAKTKSAGSDVVVEVVTVPRIATIIVATRQIIRLHITI
jgi:hypothetical protein